VSVLKKVGSRKRLLPLFLKFSSPLKKEVEKILNEGAARYPSHPICLDGARACPPEDCGGTGGYLNLCEIIQNPGHEEYESMKEWLNGDFDPDAFDIQKVNK